jgi:2-keto-3-deoxy-6-phosphogluconate aldolase
MVGFSFEFIASFGFDYRCDIRPACSNQVQKLCEHHHPDERPGIMKLLECLFAWKEGWNIVSF